MPKTLEKQFIKKLNAAHFLFKQIWRDDDWAIYSQQTYNLKKTKIEGKQKWFELIKIKKQRNDSSRIFFGREIFYKKNDESYPTENSWGYHGWTFPSLTEANDFLTKKKKELKKLQAKKLKTKKHE